MRTSKPFLIAGVPIAGLALHFGDILKYADAFGVSPSSISCRRILRSSSKDNIETPIEISPTWLSRQEFFASIVSSATIATAAAVILHPQTSNADEPNNLYYKSKADEEDPLAVFGKSLQNMSVDSSTTEASKDAPSDNLSFSDIALPVDATTPAPSMGGDLNKAIQEKKDSQQRRIDPRTHG